MSQKGKKQSQILASEARKMEQINIATGEANAIVAKATARAEGIEKVSLALQRQLGERAATLNVAEQYVNAFSNLAKTNNTVVLPANVGDAGSMVAQALAVYGQVTGKPKNDPPPPSGGLTDSSTDSASAGGDQTQKGGDGDTQKDKSSASAARDFRQVEGSPADSHMRWNPVSSRSHFTAASSPTRARDFS